ncbi:MAG: PBS lyase HEAT-like repeat protein [Methanoregula sp. PtaU1.Bin051]|nr:MAG: PBS lyase HEAT-like repeat protein [Methanoregula sp. PtaU1.Bin051]
MCVERLTGSWPGKALTTVELYRLIDETEETRNREDRIRAIIGMGESGDPRVVTPLIACSRDRDAEVRGYATEALHKLRSGRAVSALIERLRDKGELPGTRQRAAAALALIRTYDAVKELKERLSDSRETDNIRRYVSEVIRKAGIR